MNGTVLITGVTGFLGKVVLEELLRCQRDLPIERIVVLVRPQEKFTPDERFRTEVVSSLCFSRLPGDWTSAVEVVSADLSSARCGIEEAIYDQLRQQTTHIIHCAGSVAFSLSAAYETISDNIASTLNIMQLARSCPNLQQLVHTSTAYGTPHSNDPIEEVLPLLQSTETLYALLEEGKVPVENILKTTGHPNLYTLAKCLTEHILMKTKEAVPLTIVRPSIISASLNYPFPGWIDSFAALAGLVAGFGTGSLRVLNANPDTVLDVVPVDVVALRLIEETFSQNRSPSNVRIVHVVSGVEKGLKISVANAEVVEYFTRHPVNRKPKFRHVGGKGTLAYRIRDAIHHAIPWQLAKGIASVRRDQDKLKRMARIRNLERIANTSFEYFSHHTYNFQANTPSLKEDFDAQKYFQVVCHGVRIYLLQKDSTKAVFAGSQARGNAGSFGWSQNQPGAKLITAFAAASVKKTLQKIFNQATFDEHSFLEAMETMPQETSIVIVPTHRSYLDSVVCLYLFFTRPELNIEMPRVLASHEFSKIPIVGWLCRQFKTIFVVRGRGKPDERLDIQLHELVKKQDNLLFFVEGQRSRTGETLPGKRGVLRSLQSTGTGFVVLPVTITYDQIPEASVFAKEVNGGAKQLATFRGLSRWVFLMLCGKVKLGNLHIQCGSALLLGPSTDVHGFVESVIASLSAKTVIKREGVVELGNETI